MKTGLLKWGFLGVACALALLVSLPFTALADDGPQPAGGGAGYTFELTGYEYGKCVNGIKIEFKLMSENDLAGYGVYESYDSTTGEVSKPAEGMFKAGQPYYLSVKFSFAPDSSESAALMCNGASYEAQKVTVSDEEAAATAVFKLPPLKAAPFLIPFTKMVEQAGDVAPGTGNFELEVANVCKETDSPVGQFDVDGSFSTEGAGSAEKFLSIRNNDFDKVLGLLSEGILVSERNLGVEGWTYDDAVWCVLLKSDAAVGSLTDGPQGESDVFGDYHDQLVFYKGEMIDGEKGPEFDFNNAIEFGGMVFTNSYDEQGEESYTPVEESVEKNVNTAAEPAALAQTDDSANAGLLTALLLVSGLGVAGAAYGARRKLAE